MQFKILPYGEQALLINFKPEISLEIHQQVKSVYLQLQALKINGVSGFIPTYNSITVCYNSELISFETLSSVINNGNYNVATTENNKNEIFIPVCYELGLDLEHVSYVTKLSISEIINLHTAESYLVYMMGFTPGFMYLGGLNKKLQVPRKDTPRLKIEAGSVGLADQQTGIYPMQTPGGWQLIGKTPLKLFDKNHGTRTKMGDYIKFEAISLDEFHKLNEYD